jgi:hypothetical protein
MQGCVQILVNREITSDLISVDSAEIRKARASNLNHFDSFGKVLVLTVNVLL